MPINFNNLPPHEWVVGPDASALLAETAGADVSTTVLSRLRKTLPPEYAAEVARQAALRERAKTKFSLAHRMFFTDKGLQQATDERIADYKARWLPDSGRVADLCCGIGGDLISIARQHAAVGWDLAADCAAFAAANLQAHGIDTSRCQVRCDDVCHVDLSSFAAWHLDPDRRPGKSRTSQLAFSVPDTGTIRRMLEDNPHGMIKLAPGCQPPEEWQAAAEAEWIGGDHECKQLLLRFGDLAEQPGLRTATIVTSGGAVHRNHGNPNAMRRHPAEEIGSFVFDPHACVMAADILDDLAAQEGLVRLAANSAYLTGDQWVSANWLQGFKVQAVLPLDIRQLKMAMRDRDIGRLEIKQRNAGQDLPALRKRLRLNGDCQATLLLTPHQGKQVAILAERVKRGV